MNEPEKHVVIVGGGSAGVACAKQLAGHARVIIVDLAQEPRRTIKTHLTVWGGGEMAAPVIAQSGLPVGRGGRNIMATIEGKDLEPFQYHDKGIMAMIGRPEEV